MLHSAVLQVWYCHSKSSVGMPGVPRRDTHH